MFINRISIRDYSTATSLPSHKKVFSGGKKEMQIEEEMRLESADLSFGIIFCVTIMPSNV